MADRPDPSLAEKVEFLSSAAAWPGARGPVSRHETHMSVVFFVDGTVRKLKKPVRFPYLDFSTPAKREAACRAEFALNQTLAPGIYQAVEPLVRTPDGLAVGGRGEPVDWLVRMRRLQDDGTLEARIAGGRLAPAELDRLAATLARFYRRTRRVPLSPSLHLARWRQALVDNARVLGDPRLGLPPGLVRRLTGLQWRFLRMRRALLAARAGRVVDGHGDLRPEHIWLGSDVRIIDRLEFSPVLRALDPADEIAFLDLECERLGAAWAGRRLRQHTLAALHDTPPEALHLFYRSYRALLRARLSIAHLKEPLPRTPEKWPRQARAYLAIAARDARALARRL